MKIFITFLFLCFSANLYSQSNYQYWEWAKSYGGSGDDITSDIKVNNGFVYVTGTFTSPTINWENTILTNNGNRDIFIAKLDTNGNTIWVKNFGGTADDSVSQLEINKNGSFVLLCQSSSNNLKIGSTQLNNPAHFYAKFDNSGNLLKAGVLPDSLAYDDIDIDNDGGVYLACNYYNHEFTFANTLVDLSPPKVPPIGIPVVFTDPHQIPNYTSGSAILKYDATGSESWIKIFQGDPISLSIAFDPSGNNIDALLLSANCVVFNGTWYGYSGTSFAESSLFFAGISTEAQVQYTKSFGAASYVYGLQIDNTGLGFLSYSTHTYGYIAGPASLYTFRNSQIQKHALEYWYSENSYSLINYDFSSLQVGDNGHSIFNDGLCGCHVFVLDSNLEVSDSIIIPDGGKLLLNKRNMAGKALYFGDNFTGNSLILKNDGVPSLPSFNLTNNGGNDIFIGKFYSPGYLPLSFNSFRDTIMFCNGMSETGLDSSIIKKNTGSGNHTFHWEPVANFKNPNSLNTNVIMPGDALVSTLTVTDNAGNSITKTIVFYKGIQSDIHLKLSDTATCSNSYIDASLIGSLFDSLYILDKSGYYKYSFDSLNQINHIYSGDGSGFNTFKISSESTKYCFDTSAVKLKLNPTYSTYSSVSVCSGSDYTFPNDTSITDITQNFHRVRYLQTSKGCDSTIVTDLIVISFAQQSEEDINICAGSNYTFPDNTTFSNVQTDTTHESVLKAKGGCDSLYIYTNLKVNPVYNNISSVKICQGSSYSFPDNTTVDNIQNDITHTSHFTSINGCDSLLTTNLHVIILDTSITKIQATLKANLNSATYQWFDCSSGIAVNSETGQSFTSSLIGSYAVQLEKEGCKDTSSCYVISYNDLLYRGEADASVYPVPSHNILNIKFISEVRTSLNTSLYNDLGKLVTSKKFNLIPGINQIAFNVSGLEKGVYTLVLLDNYNQEKIIKKIIVD